MNSSFSKMLSVQRTMLTDLCAGVEAGADVDELLCGHDILHTFAAEIRDLDLDALTPIGGEDRAVVARGVLTEMVELLDDTLANLVAGLPGNLVTLGQELRALFCELAACIPTALALYRTRTRALDAWLEQHPDALAALMEGTEDSRLEPFELLDALMVWMEALPDLERAELKHRFRETPGGVIRESLARAELSAELNGGIDGLLS